MTPYGIMRVASLCHFLQYPLECGAGRGGFVYPKGVNSVATSGLDGRKALVGTGWPILFGINGLETSGLTM